jgi:hypothetical protein
MTVEGGQERVKCWCCQCGQVNPKPLEVCPVSEYEMSHMKPPGKGLTHLLAYSVHPKAVRIFERLADTRAEMRQGFSRANLNNIRAQLEAHTSPRHNPETVAKAERDDR